MNAERKKKIEQFMLMQALSGLQEDDWWQVQEELDEEECRRRDVEDRPYLRTYYAALAQGITSNDIEYWINKTDQEKEQRQEQEKLMIVETLQAELERDHKLVLKDGKFQFTMTNNKRTWTVKGGINKNHDAITFSAKNDRGDKEKSRRFSGYAAGRLWHCKHEAGYESLYSELGQRGAILSLVEAIAKKRLPSHGMGKNVGSISRKSKAQKVDSLAKMTV